MPLSKEDAVKIARDFLESRMPEASVRLDPRVPAQRENAQANKASHWSVMFERIDPPDVVTSPGEVIVVVDEETGQAEIQLNP